VKSNFYKERLECNNHKTVIEDVISEYVQAKVIVKGVVDENLVIPELKDESSKPVFGADPVAYKKSDAPISRPPSSVDVVADVMSMF